MKIAHELNKFTPGMLGCFLSHFSIIKDAVDKGYDKILIFEDDVKFMPGFDFMMDKALKEMPEDADFIWLGYNIHSQVKLEQIVEINKSWIRTPSHWGTHCYGILNRETIRKVYDGLREMKNQVDIQLILNVLPKQNINHYAVVPALVIQNSQFESDCQTRKAFSFHHR
jgi:GR25 family glycosyltransferase involved in LPS biosynthesis